MHTIYEHYNITHSPEELLAILVPPDTVDGLDAGVLAVEDRVLAMDPVLRHLDTGHRHRGVGSGRVQSCNTNILVESNF